MDTWIAPDADRVNPDAAGDERTMLDQWLDYHRQTLLRKCAGLDQSQLARRAVPPSTLSLLGLVRHMAEVERWWFRRMAAGADLPDVYCSPENLDGDFDDVDTADAAADLATFAAEVAAARAAAAGLDLEHTFVSRRGTTMNLRWVYAHMIEEYARHNGHADLLRECVDGAVGD